MAGEIMEEEKKYEMNFYIHCSIAELQGYLLFFQIVENQWPFYTFVPGLCKQINEFRI